MAYRYGLREQRALLPPSIEEYVAENHPVRAYDAFVDALDLKVLGIDLNADKVGNAQYDPQAMLKLLVYGYSYGIRSSRKLEQATHENLSFIWLMGGLKPDHKTIAEFRRKHKKALRRVLKQCVRVCLRLNLIAGNILFVDGAKVRANAGREQTHDRTYYEKHLKEIDVRIDQVLDECEEIDRQEEGEGSLVAMDQGLGQAQNLKGKIREALEAVPETYEKINLTDPECALMRSRQGSHASYNVQTVVDDQHGLIVHAEAVRDTSDVNQFARQIDQANGELPKPCQAACGDAGYADTEELSKIDAQGIQVIVPSQRQALHEEEKPFSKSHFVYDAEQDGYQCPEGHRLSYEGTDKSSGKRHYQITDPVLCHTCPHFGQCTEAKRGRKIIRLPHEAKKEKFEAQYAEAASQKIYARRKTRVEHPFGHIKRNLKTDAFLLRGLDGVGAETSLLATCFNMVRMITILGVSTLVDKFRSQLAPAVAW
jgi:transposase